MVATPSVIVCPRATLRKNRVWTVCAGSLTSLLTAMMFMDLLYLHRLRDATVCYHRSWDRAVVERPWRGV